MYPINPGLAGALANDHVAELRRSAANRAIRAELPRQRSLRRKAGWFLVSLELRLALPRHSVLHRSVLPGRSPFVRRSVVRAAR
jgi:hypothetical protein